MALYNELPVYKSAYDLLLQIFDFSVHLSREYKFTIGEKLKNSATDVLTNIYRANRTQDKIKFVEEAREQTELVRLYIRILHDVKQISLKKTIFLNQYIEDVSKQLAGWQKSLLKINT